MPKGLPFKNFGRRKSSSNVLDLDGNTPTEPSSGFRILERPDKKPYGADAPGAQSRPVIRPFQSPLQERRGKSTDDLSNLTKAAKSESSTWQLKWPRGSAGTTHSGSSGNNGSIGTSGRYSSTSTLPSSVDQEREQDRDSDDELFPARKPVPASMIQDPKLAADNPLPPPPSFKSRTARAFSFGRKDTPPPVVPTEQPPVPPPHAVPTPPTRTVRAESPQRERALTTSSYASTAVPSRPELSLTSPDFGSDDFGSMFDDLKGRPLQPPAALPAFHRTDSDPIFPPRAYSRQFTPSPKPQPPVPRDDTASPYSWDGAESREDLSSSRDELMMANSTASSPSIPEQPAPMVPAHGGKVAQILLGAPAAGYAPVPEGKYSPDLSRSSTDSQSEAEDTKELAFPSRQTQLDDGDRWGHRVQLQDPQAPAARPTILKKPLKSSLSSKKTGTSPSSSGVSSPIREPLPAMNGSQEATPRAPKLPQSNYDDESLFDSSPLASLNRAIRPAKNHNRSDSNSTMKKMTKEQFQALQRRGDVTMILRGDHGSGDEYDDDEDADRVQKMAVQRRKQEANMSVYRQQMKKVTGGGPTDLPLNAPPTRPGVDRGSSAPAAIGGMGLHFGGISGTPPADVTPRNMDDDEDDDVPLGILQAHGFPSSNRPPTRQGENDLLYQRRTSVAGSVAGGGGAGGPLPPFARRLPADPYFGAGLVNQSARESLALGSGASVYGGAASPAASPGGHPGGLVGVIAGEERARAMRRGSPSAAMMAQSGGALPTNMGMPQNGRAMSMVNMQPPQMFMPNGMPMMPMMPPMTGQMSADQQLQMQQFMQMQMQFMQNMQNMMQAQMGQTPPPMQPSPSGDYLGVNFTDPSRPMSMMSQGPGWGSQNGMPGQRAMTMTAPPSGWAGVPASRPTSVIPGGLNGGGPGPGYTPSIAPSERSNVGMPSRYRPVTQNGDDRPSSVHGGRSNSLSSSLTLQRFAGPGSSTPNLLGGSTIRVVDRPKSNGTLMSKMGLRKSVGQDEDDEEGWADMKKKRETRKKTKGTSQDEVLTEDLSSIYRHLD